MVNKNSIPFFQLFDQTQTLKKEIEESIQRVLKSGFYVLGPEVEAFEQEFANYIGARFAVGVGSGTDALTLSLKSLNIQSEDEILAPANTATPSIISIIQAGAIPILVDMEANGFQIDPELLEKSITSKTKAIVAVHLYGQPVDMSTIITIAQKHNLSIIEDACQAHGALYKNKKVGILGDMGCFSFYPTKNLGCFGDGGIIVLNDYNRYKQLKLLRNYGQKSKYEHAIIGINSRLDELQASILRVKLKSLDVWNLKRKRIAQMYSNSINHEIIKTPLFDENGAWHLYVIRTKLRNQLKDYLALNGIGTVIHYPTPIHLQPAFKYLGYKLGDFPRSEENSQDILSLPLYPELSDYCVNRICELIQSFKVSENY